MKKLLLISAILISIIGCYIIFFKSSLLIKKPLIKESMTKKDLKINSTTLLYDGFLRIEYYNIKHRLFNGGWTKDYTRELVIRPYVVAALPYDPRLNKIVLVEQFRIGAIQEKNTPWLIEIVAGLMDKQGENHKELLKREIREEIHLEVVDLLPINEYFSSPGYSTEKVQLFCVKVDAAKVPEFGGLVSENEDIKIHLVSPQEAFAAVHTGQIKNAHAIIALQWLELNLNRVKEKWK